mgnify:CR=1 FL=1
MAEDNESSKSEPTPLIYRSLIGCDSKVVGEGSFEKLIALEWKIIDELWALAQESRYDKQRSFYYQTLASHTNTLARLLKIVGVKVGDSQDLAKLLQKIVKKARRLAKSRDLGGKCAFKVER